MQEYLVFATMAFALSAYLSVEYYCVRTIVLDTANDHYSVYRGTMLTTTQHCHNIYIRLLCNRTGMKLMQNINPLAITQASTSFQHLRSSLLTLELPAFFSGDEASG